MFLVVNFSVILSTDPMFQFHLLILEEREREGEGYGIYGLYIVLISMDFCFNKSKLLVIYHEKNCDLEFIVKKTQTIISFFSYFIVKKSLYYNRMFIIIIQPFHEKPCY